jgi:hypothetical protein
MAYKESKERYDGGGLEKYLVYRSPQRRRGGEAQDRVRVKRLYFPADASNIRIEGPQEVRTRTGRQVHGVVVRYAYVLAGGRARRGNTAYQVPERRSERAKVVPLPNEARGVRLTDEPPEGPKMAVA